MNVWLAGASGLVGGELLRLLLEDAEVSRVVSVGRRRLALTHPKLVQAEVDFLDPAAFAALGAADTAFSCLGTTMKKAGSRAAFRAVDHDAVLAFARAARTAGAQVFVHVSSLSANPNSPMFYASVKGQAEEDATKVGFDSVYALRPSILDGERSDPRPLEHVGLVVARALAPVLGRLRPTPAVAVARAMIHAAKAKQRGAHVIDAAAIHATGAA